MSANARGASSSNCRDFRTRLSIDIGVGEVVEGHFVAAQSSTGGDNILDGRG